MSHNQKISPQPLPKDIKEFIEKEAEKATPLIEYMPETSDSKLDYDRTYNQIKYSVTQKRNLFKSGFTLCYSQFVKPLKEEEAVSFGEWLLKNRLQAEIVSQELKWKSRDQRTQFAYNDYTTRQLYDIFKENL